MSAQEFFRFHIIADFSLNGISLITYSSLQAQRNIMGEYNNPDQEELFMWIDKSVEKQGVFAGSMPLMANLRLSTGRPIVNHPHYEDVGLRERTKKVYQVCTDSLQIYVILLKVCNITRG